MSAIRSRIFVPVVILIVLFPVLSWALFPLCLRLVRKADIQPELRASDGIRPVHGGAGVSAGWGLKL